MKSEIGGTVLYRSSWSTPSIFSAACARTARTVVLPDASRAMVSACPASAGGTRHRTDATASSQGRGCLISGADDLISAAPHKQRSPYAHDDGPGHGSRVDGGDLRVQ